MFEKEAEEYLDTESKYLIEDNEGNIINIAKKVKQAFKDGAEFGYNKANEWHYPSKGEYPECDENKKLWLYFKDYYANDRSCEYPIYRTSTGVYKTSFLNKDVKLFAEKSKGYESEILPRDIIAWMYIPEPPKDIE